MHSTAPSAHLKEAGKLMVVVRSLFDDTKEQVQLGRAEQLQVPVLRCCLFLSSTNCCCIVCSSCYSHSGLKVTDSTRTRCWRCQKCIIEWQCCQQQQLQRPAPHCCSSSAEHAPAKCCKIAVSSRSVLTLDSLVHHGLACCARQTTKRGQSACCWPRRWHKRRRNVSCFAKICDLTDHSSAVAALPCILSSNNAHH
jgi:hypothetical protein